MGKCHDIRASDHGRSVVSPALTQADLTDGDGTINIFVVRPQHARKLIEAADRGDEGAITMVLACADIIELLEERAMPCMVCNRWITTPIGASYVFVGDRPASARGFLRYVVCPKCADHPALELLVTDVATSGWLIHAQPADQRHAAGHA